MKKSNKVTMKMIAIVLVFSVVVGITISHVNKSKAEEPVIFNSEEWEQKQVSNHEIVNDDGIISMTFYFDDGTKKVSVYENGVLTNWYYNENDEEVYCDNLDIEQMLEDIDVSVDELQNSEDENDTDDIETDNDDLLNPTRSGGKKITWTKPVKENYKHQFWYKTSTNTKIDWLKIGCKAKYVINVSKLSSNQFAYVESYKNSVNTIRNKMKNLDDKCDVHGIEMCAFIAVSGAMAVMSCGVTAMLELLATALGVGGANLYDVYVLEQDVKSEWANAKEKYLSIRNYGKAYK